MLNIFSSLLKLMVRQNLDRIIWDGQYLVGHDGEMSLEASEFQPESKTREMWDDLEFALGDTKAPSFTFKLEK